MTVNKTYFENMFRIMLKHHRDPARTPQTAFPINKEMIDELIDNTIFAFLNEPMLVEINPPCIVFGDIHGQFDDLISWFDYVGWPPNKKCLFLGDYVDRGDYNLEVACVLFILKVLYPSELVLLRGNHETIATNKSYGFLDECNQRCAPDGDHVYRRFNHAFACMSIAALIADQMLCMHGGLSPSLKSLDQIRRIKRPVDVPDYGLLCDLCWSDPDNELEKGVGYQDSDRGAGHLFGKDTCKDFCARMNLTMIVRAHQVPEPNGGYQFVYGKPKYKLMTIFSAPAYMRKRNDAAAMLVDEQVKCTFKILRPTPAHDISRVTKRR